MNIDKLNNIDLAKKLIFINDNKELFNIIKIYFDQMNCNSFWDVLKKVTKDRDIIIKIAKLHLKASNEKDGLYYLELSNKLIGSYYNGDIDTVLEQNSNSLTKELVGILLDTAQKSMASYGNNNVVPYILGLISKIINKKGYIELKPYLYNQYIIYYLYTNQPQKALEYTNKALKCYIDNDELIDRININRGLVLYKLGKYKEAIELYESIKDTTINIVDFNINLSLFYKELGQFSKSLKILFQLLDKNISDLNQLAKIYGNIASLYGDMGLRNKEREYLLFSLKASKKAKDRNYDTILANYFNLTNFYLKLENFTKVNFWLNVFKNSATRVEKVGDYYYIYALLKIRIFIKKEDYTSALAIIDKVANSIKDNTSLDDYLSFLIYKGICFLGFKKFKDAYNIFFEVLKLSIDSNHIEFTQISRGYLGICQYFLNNDKEAKENIIKFFSDEKYLRDNLNNPLTQFFFSIDRDSIYNTIIEILIDKKDTLLLFMILQNIKSNAVNFNIKQRVSYKKLIDSMDSKTLIVDFYISKNVAICLIIKKNLKKPILKTIDLKEDEILRIYENYQKIVKIAHFYLKSNPFKDIFKILSNKLLMPIENYLKSVDRIVFCRNSYLNLFPIHIFPFKNGLLYEYFAVSYALNSALIYFDSINSKKALILCSTKQNDSKLVKDNFKQEAIEVDTVLKQKFNTKIYIDDSDSKKIFFNNKASVVHLINHGLFDNHKSEQSGMFLKEGGRDVFISINELFSNRFRADFIFMSGCVTGVVYPIKGEEYLGIVSYLHSNRVKFAILSMWNIPAINKNIIKVVKDFYKFWIEENLHISIALQKSLIKNKQINPIDYAGFVLFGG